MKGNGHRLKGPGMTDAVSALVHLSHGALVQPEERLVLSQKVRGSNPLRITMVP